MLTALMPIVQILSLLVALWGIGHTSETADTIIQYGATSEDGPTVTEWMNSFGSIAVGAIGFVATKLFQSSKYSELWMAIIAEARSPSDPATIRRLAFAVIDWLETKYAASKDATAAQWWKDMLTNLRAEIAKTPTVAPVSSQPPTS